MIECPNCKASHAVDDFLGCVVRFSASTGASVFRCSKCGAEIDVRPKTGAIEIGYVYGAGALHFACMIEVPVDGLVCDYSEGFHAEYDGRTWGI